MTDLPLAVGPAIRTALAVPSSAGILMPLVATLISDPSNPVLDVSLAAVAATAVSDGSIHWLSDGVACDLRLPQGMSAEEARAALSAALDHAPVDIVIQDADTRRKRLLMADMDSTMIRQECVDELADEAGIGARVAAITARAMNGEIAFEPALRERVGLLKGLPLATIDKVLKERIVPMPGGHALLATMKANGAYTVLVSGGFTHFSSQIAAKLGFDENRANVLIEAGDALAGTVAEPVLGRQAKVDALREIAGRLGLALEETMAVGDGANDLDMLQLAGSGIALHAKPAVAAQARMRVDHGDLTALLYIQGYRESDFVVP